MKTYSESLVIRKKNIFFSSIEENFEIPTLI